MPGLLYRVRQLLSAVRAGPLDPADLELVRKYLPPPGVELYLSMPRGDQRHSLTILRGLLAQGHIELPLLQAALLHDVAKAQVGLWHRTIVVLANAISPSLLPRLASANSHSWRYPLYLSLHHPELGAQAAERAGLDPRAVTLIRRHQGKLLPIGDGQADTEQQMLDEWQHALKVLDDQN